MITKIFGAVSILLGAFFLFIFPENIKFQPKFFTNLAIILGIFLILFGIYLLKV